MVVSTNCRGCSIYLKIEGTKVSVPSLSSSSPRYQATSSIPDDPNPANAPMVRSEPPNPQPTPPQKPKAAPAAQPATKATSVTPKTKSLPQAQEGKKASKTTPSAKTPPATAKKKVSKPVKKAAPPNPSPSQPEEKTFQKIITSPASSEKKKSLPQDPSPAPAQSPSPLANRPSKPKAPPPPAKPDHSATQAADEPASAEVQPSRYRPATPQKAEPAHRGLINREKKRSVLCFECDQSHEILADSSSALCPHCGAYIGLKNHDIRDQINSRIQTRGDVFVHKKGSVTGITIQCHNLTIEGEIKGGAECSGNFIIRKTGKINGPVSSDRVIVERRAVVDFMSTVKAREVIIDGEVTGSVSCKKLVLKKRATLDGDLEVASLSVEDGARHTGNIRMTSA